MENFPKAGNISEGLFNANTFKSFFPKEEGNSSLLLICGTNDMNSAAKSCAEECRISNVFVF